MLKISKSFRIAVLAASLVSLASPLQAQDKPAGFGRRIVEVPHITVPATGRQPSDPNAPAKLCFWTNTNNGTGFAQSGFCNVPSSMTVGALCRCNSNSAGRPDGKWAGKVVLAPASDGSTPVVR